MKDDWLLFVFVTWFFVLIGLGVYQLQGDAASTSDQQDVALTADAEIETKTNESVTDKAQRAQENLAPEVDGGPGEAGPKRRSAEPATVAETSEQPEAQGSTDTDGDGVDDVRDRCEDTVAGMGVGADGCRLTGRLRDPVDKDGDQVAEYLDKCPRTVEGAKVDEKGCEIEKPLARLEDVLFESGRAALRPGAKETLTELVSILENHPDIRVRLEGYTDNVGNESANEMLSQKRAESIKDYLVSEGIDGSRIKTIGMGESNPIATNETGQGRAQNRRVDIMRAKADTIRSRHARHTTRARHGRISDLCQLERGPGPFRAGCRRAPFLMVSGSPQRISGGYPHGARFHDGLLGRGDGAQPPTLERSAGDCGRSRGDREDPDLAGAGTA